MHLQGNFIFGRIQEVQSGAFWEVEQNIGLIVNCSRDPRDAKYPASATSQIEVKHFDVRSKEHRQEGFDSTWPAVLKCLLDGKDVLLHCQESFHRAPICWAAMYQRIAGVGYKVVHVIIFIFT